MVWWELRGLGLNERCKRLVLTRDDCLVRLVVTVIELWCRRLKERCLGCAEVGLLQPYRRRADGMTCSGGLIEIDYSHGTDWEGRC